MTRQPRPDERSAIRSLQGLLPYADPDLIDAALDGPFLCRVAVDAGTVVGYAVALPGPETALSELVVTPAHRGAGHGRALVDAVAAAADADRLVVTTPAGADAVDFYRALGFETDRRLASFYDDGTAALRFVRRE